MWTVRAFDNPFFSVQIVFIQRFQLLIEFIKATFNFILDLVISSFVLSFCKINILRRVKLCPLLVKYGRRIILRSVVSKLFFLILFFTYQQKVKKLP